MNCYKVSKKMNFLELKEATRATLLLTEVLLKGLYLAHFDQEAGYIYSHIPVNMEFLNDTY